MVKSFVLPLLCASAFVLAASAPACRAPSAQSTSGSATVAEGSAAGVVMPVDGAGARALVEAGAVLLDVRSPEEFAAGHVDGAINVPVEAVGSSDAFADDAVIVVYCRSGRRSAAAASTLASRGFEVHDLGPMASW